MTFKEKLRVHNQIVQDSCQHLREFLAVHGKTVREIVGNISSKDPNAVVHMATEYGRFWTGKAGNCLFSLYSAGRWAQVKRMKIITPHEYEVVIDITPTAEDSLLRAEHVSGWAYI